LAEWHADHLRLPVRRTATLTAVGAAR